MLLETEKILALQSEVRVDERVALAQAARIHLVDPAHGDLDLDARLEILLILAQDAEVRVRQALAEALAKADSIPRDLAMRLAADIDLVAVPMLKVWRGFQDSDLISIVKNDESQEKWMAVAGRPSVSPALSMALIECGNAEVVTSLVRNEGANIPDDGFAAIVDRHGSLIAVQKVLVERQSLPEMVVERLVRIAADHLLDQLIQRHELSPKLAGQLVSEVHGRAVVGLTSNLGSERLVVFIEHLEALGAVTHSIILRCLCAGNLNFLTHLVALRSLQSVSWVRERLFSGSENEIRSVWARGKLPKELEELGVSVINVLMKSGAEDASLDDYSYRAKLIEKNLSLCADFRNCLSEDDIDYILDVKFGTNCSHQGGAGQV